MTLKSIGDREKCKGERVQGETKAASAREIEKWDRKREMKGRDTPFPLLHMRKCFPQHHLLFESKRRGWGCSYILFIHLPLLHRSYSYITTHTAIASEKWPKRSDCRPQRSPCGVKHGFNNSKPKALELEKVTKHDPTENVCDQTPRTQITTLLGWLEYI